MATEYLTTKQYAEMVGIAPFTAYQQRREGRGPKYVRDGRNGRIVRYKREDVIAYMDAKRVGGERP